MAQNSSTVSEKGEQAAFDEYAAEYDEALQQGLSVSGESKEYFAEVRARWVARQLAALNVAPKSIFDFGCGTGAATPFLFEHIGTTEKVIGTDISAASLNIARRDFPERTEFVTLADFTPSGSYDLAFCNGVFHHIPLGERMGAVKTVYDSLCPGGLWAFWENNPWNPGTRYIMSKIPFDRDAVTLTPPEARTLLQTGGFEIVRTDFMFLFPAALGFLRGIEPLFSGMPLGAQYMVLCRKPGG